MRKGYTLEVIDNKDKKNIKVDTYEFCTIEELNLDRELYHATDFCIVYEWAQFDDGLGNYEIEIARYNW